MVRWEHRRWIRSPPLHESPPTRDPGRRLAVATFFLGVVPSLASAKSFHVKIASSATARKAAKQDPNRGTLSVAARRAIHRGYLVPNQARYDRQKARLTRRAESREALTAPVSGPLAPSIISGRSWQGINSTNVAPPDETSAVGTTRYIELVNVKFAIYNKTSNSPISTGTINSLVGAASTDDVFDVQIIWDPTTSRFYYAADDVVSSSNNRLAFGFSKTASPSSAADFCKYTAGFGVNFPDYPKLGDSQFFTMIGSNVFSGSGSFLGSDLLAISKPPAGASCPAASTFKVDDAAPLMTDATTKAFTPVAANEIDTKATGFAVARPRPLPATRLSLFKVTKTRRRATRLFRAPEHLSRFRTTSCPSNAPQKGSINKIDTWDARRPRPWRPSIPRTAASSRSGRSTPSTSGGRAAVRWYEIDPAANSLLQSGTASNPSLFQFNGAISPNRQVNGATHAGGNAMVLNYNSSSSAAFPGIRTVSKFATGAQSAPVVVKNSPGPLSGFDCDLATQFCRWGDYAAATPDPSTANRIWQVSQFAVGSGSRTTGPSTSRTWNFLATP